MSRKLAGWPLYSLIMSIVAIASPAPFTTQYVQACYVCYVWERFYVTLVPVISGIQSLLTGNVPYIFEHTHTNTCTVLYCPVLYSTIYNSSRMIKKSI